MIETLPLFHRIAGKPVIVVGTGAAADAKRRLVLRAGGLVLNDIEQGVAAGARLAFVAHDDEVEALADVARLRIAGVLVNATDRPDLCDFTTPSILDRSPVLIAIGTGGASAGLAKALRLRLEQILPQSLGRLAAALSEARSAMRTRWHDAGARRRALDSALDQNGVLDPLREDSAERIKDWLDSNEGDNATTLFEIVLTSDDPEDLTLRQARMMGSADMIAYEPDVPQSILNRARADAERLAIAKGEMPTVKTPFLVLLRVESRGNPR